MSLPAIPERKVPVIVKPDYTVFLERTSGLTFVHCDVHSRWTSRVKDELVRDWQTFRALHEAPILALHTPGDTKHHKFLSMFGFEFATAFTDAATGDEKHLFIHSGA
jgi:hypothetical protein